MEMNQASAAAASDLRPDAEQIKYCVVSYWTRRAESFASLRSDEMTSYKAELWRREIRAKLPERQNMRILDAGCGTGFFEMLLAPAGYQMTGIDLTPEMIDEGRMLLKQYGIEGVQMQVMDAEKLSFPDASFDAVISRNLTWTLPAPERAYREWFRVLKPGGILLNYDAEYAKGFHRYDQAENCAHSDLEKDLIEECHSIYHMMSVSELDRPKWDIETLIAAGFQEAAADLSVGDRLYGTKDQFYMPDRMFCVRAVK